MCVLYVIICICILCICKFLILNFRIILKCCVVYAKYALYDRRSWKLTMCYVCVFLWCLSRSLSLCVFSHTHPIDSLCVCSLTPILSHSFSLCVLQGLAKKTLGFGEIDNAFKKVCEQNPELASVESK